MENPRVLNPSDTRQPRRRHGAKAILLWLLIVAGCALYGYFGPGHSDQTQLYGEPFDVHAALEVMVCFLALGVGLATCISAGFLLLCKVRTERFSKPWAVVLLLSVAFFVSGPLAFLVMRGAQAVRRWHILHEDMAFLTIAGVSWWTIEASLVAFLLISLLIIFTRRRQDDNRVGGESRGGKPPSEAPRHNRGSDTPSLVLVFLILTLDGTCLSHEGPVHMEISRVAAVNSTGLQSFLSDNLGAGYAPFDASPALTWNQTIVTPGAIAPVEWVKQGSYHEDDYPRSLNHFYTVTRGEKELTDVALLWKIFYYRIPYGWYPSPVDSWYWVSSEHSASIRRWQDARDDQYKALTNTAAVTRAEYLARMLFDLGSVLHLNQDLSSPDHTRNDAHPPPPIDKNWIEAHGAKYYQANRARWFPSPPPERLGWYYWRDAGFTKLQDFWDRNKYAGTSAAPLDADARGDAGQQLGLAEFSNGNFLGEDALYKEYFSPNDIHYLPFPSLETGTTFPTVRSHLASGVVTSFLKDGRPIQRISISKTNDGISVTHHSVLNYLGAKFPKKGGPVVKVSSTINDPNVLQDYHSILIPKAIEYSAGILDYFFRGYLRGQVTWNEETGRYTLEIWNDSEQDLKGGAFTLYRDDNNGNRTPVPGVTSDYSGSLAEDEESFHLSFPPPADDTKQFVLIYKGTIGSSGGAAIDPIDENLAIAVLPFSILRFQVYADDDAAVMYFVCLEDGYYGGQCPNFSGDSYIYAGGWLDESTRIRGDTVFYVNYYDNYYDPDNDVDFTLYTYFNKAAPITTNSFTLLWANRGDDFPEGVEGPAVLDSWYVRKRIAATNDVLISY